MTRPPVPSSLSDAETRRLQRLVDGRRVVEAGALLGYSALAMARTAARVVSIDRHDGYGPSTWAPYRSNLARFGDGQVIRPVRGEALLELPRVSADVAFLDLTGDERTTAAALRALHPSIQFVAVHDFDRNGCRGVARALASSTWRVVELVDTLAVAQRVG